MTIQIEPRHTLSPSEIDEIEDRLHEHNSYVTGCHDGQGLGYVIRDQLGLIRLQLGHVAVSRKLSPRAKRQHCVLQMKARAAQVLAMFGLPREAS